MLSKSDIKYIRSLSIKKYRQRYKKFLVEGEKSVLEAIYFCGESLNKIFVSKDFFLKNSGTLKNYHHLIQEITNEELALISNLTNNTSALAILNIPQQNDFSLLFESETIVYLDTIKDPGNLGTIIRSCDWFGIGALVCSPDCVDIYNPKVIQATMGSIFRVKFYEIDYFELSKSLSGKSYNFYAADISGENMYDCEFAKPMVLVAGNESKGISEDIAMHVNKKIAIPGKGNYIDSLNVGVATSILLAQIFRPQK
ncbi:MAG: TrmH family RNA methyltransferase [Deltaproteobacteria bacterium]